eukprot:6181564-Pleurochrysis_carterae.AAC.4
MFETYAADLPVSELAAGSLASKPAGLSASRPPASKQPRSRSRQYLRIYEPDKRGPREMQARTCPCHARACSYEPIPPSLTRYVHPRHRVPAACHTCAGVCCVLFDEFHERSGDADLCLALCLAAQRRRAAPLRLLIMSATLDGMREELDGLVGAEG